jgi:hypothetical protein
MADYNEPYLTLKLNGLNYDTPAYDLPLDVWTDAQNIRFQDGATEKFSGQEQVFGTPDFDPNWFIPVGYGANYYWVYADTVGIAVTDMASHFDITPAAGISGSIDLDTNWNGDLINNLVVMNNGKENPWWWDGATSNPMTALPNWPADTTTEVIRTYKNFLVAMNVSNASGDFPDRVKWSDAAPSGSVPTSWDEADPTGEAGEYDVADTQGELVDGMPLGDMFIIYKRNSCYIMQYIGGQFVFQFRKLYDNVGALAANCVGAVGGSRHLVLTKDDLVIHDGSPARPKSVLDDKMRTWLFSTMNEDKYQRSYISAHHSQREMWVCFPSGTSDFADAVLVWNYEEDTLGVRQIPLSRYATSGIVDPGEATNWDADSQAWDADTTLWDAGTFSATAYAMLLGDQSNSQFLEADKTDQFDGENFLSYVTRESMPLLDRHNFKLVKGVYPRMTSTGNPTVYFRLGTQVNATDAIEWSAEMPFVVGVDDKVDFYSKGRYHSLRCRSEDDVNWALHSFDFDVELAERW